MLLDRYCNLQEIAHTHIHCTLEIEMVRNCCNRTEKMRVCGEMTRLKNSRVLCYSFSQINVLSWLCKFEVWKKVNMPESCCWLYLSWIIAIKRLLQQQIAFTHIPNFYHLQSVRFEFYYCFSIRCLFLE